MTFVITQNCCTDASCVPVCPVDCIRPVPTEDGQAAQMLYIDPDTCVDCGACVEACPVDAIYHEDELPDDQKLFQEINANYFVGQPLAIRPIAPMVKPDPIARGSLRVAVVGAGPAACYAVTELVRIKGVEVNIFEKLPTPYGLIRFGVAPDHQRTKGVVSGYEAALGNRDVNCFFNIEVGRDISHDELLDHHHAVVYAVGASRSQDLGIPGEQLYGNYAAADVVGWYNGHPGYADLDIDLSGRRAVIVGNGNVALDVARMLVMDRDDLSTTDIAEHALAALNASTIEEVVVLGRRGAADGAFSVGELLALGNLRGVDVMIEGDIGEHPGDGFDQTLKYDTIRQYAERPTTPGNRRIVLRFNTSPSECIGDQSVQGLVVAHAGGTDTIETSLVLRSIGYRGSAIDGLPFDEESGTVPNEDGRVRGDDGEVLPGAYVTGWIKRGPRGVIGTNRTCAHETIGSLFEDFHKGQLADGTASNKSLDRLLESRGVRVVDLAGWRAIDALERERGAAAGRPRVKVVEIPALLAAAHAR
ncbi:FAD-dependent oxidoreductase [Mycobacteroides abscessus]|uniref:ferredoxin--NADP(+) reductase n=1 Tax=Mycobacteroides abscessus subsp. massiliense TaxID=1962118 RepID=A0A1U3NPU4_9MYCO|nr:FAD-dependent oxidoreductase [Mycobacteroides abscessus]EHM20756.1 NADPH-ferredoxin reductase fpra [Mycobacteroides abscessus subsp. massiliense CCUG 48898 = JCM 15300]MBL3748654.1 FAD-dependent oxidoreductase [Mycobacteroides abscessus subsp. massiliense]MBN7315249.1 FAD-dependent oxidoreductase [Mycobacteroides abscessus subsp. massiliense]MDM2645681.1 FAD-dependent oxidoreductase [Mycobacteroides abscessus]MDM2656102.1 FAD-dependent oxidoreductase [Mycobacteroides abscessus]